MDYNFVSLESNIKNSKFVLSGNYEITWPATEFISLVFESSSDISIYK